MKLIDEFYTTFQASNPMKFNEDLIHIRKNDYKDMPNIIKGVLKSMETIKGVEIISCDLITEETLIPYKVIDGKNTVSVYDERKEIVEIKFKITDDDKSEIVTKQLFIPKLMDGQYFILNGNRYFPILQLVDTNVYSVVSSLKGKEQYNLKTMIMPISFVLTKNCVVTDSMGVMYEFVSNELKLFSYCINFVYYYLSKYGIIETLKVLGLEEIQIDDSEEDFMDNFASFRINKKLVLRVPETLINNPKYRNKICSFIDAFSNRINLDKIMEDDYWIKKLGGHFTKNQNTKDKKAMNVMSSLERILLEFTKDRLQFSPEIVENTYTLINYIVEECEYLSQLDNMDLANKRLRFAEYLVYPLAIHASNFTYRLLNKVGKITLSTKKQATSIKPNLLIDDARTHDLIRYDNAVNGLQLFQSILKVTIRGPQGINGDISASQRDLHPSYVGRLSLVFSSPSAVGETNILTPFCEIHDNLYFFKK